VLPVSLTVSILAVLVAAVTLLVIVRTPKKLLLQSQATDQWAFYQAKIYVCTKCKAWSTCWCTISPVGQRKKRDTAGEYKKKLERYESDKDNISEKAKDLEKERDVVRPPR